MDRFFLALIAALYTSGVLALNAVIMFAVVESKHLHGPASLAGGAFACLVIDIAAVVVAALAADG